MRMGFCVKRSGFKAKPDWKPLKAGKPMARGTSKLKPVGARAKRTGQGKVAPTAEERAWMAFVADFGCVACWWQMNVKTPCAVHHIIEGGRRLGHMMTIGLCDPGHHQGSPTPEKISRHPDKKRFELAYGTEYEMHAFLLSQYKGAD